MRVLRGPRLGPVHPAVQGPMARPGAEREAMHVRPLQGPDPGGEYPGPETKRDSERSQPPEVPVCRNEEGESRDHLGVR